MRITDIEPTAQRIAEAAIQRGHSNIDPASVSAQIGEPEHTAVFSRVMIAVCDALETAGYKLFYRRGVLHIEKA